MENKTEETDGTNIEDKYEGTSNKEEDTAVLQDKSKTGTENKTEETSLTKIEDTEEASSEDSKEVNLGTESQYEEETYEENEDVNSGMESQYKEGISNKEEEDVAVSEDELNIGRKNKVEEIGLIKIKEGKSLLTAISDISVIMPTSLARHSGEASSEEKPEDQLIHTGLKEETHMTEITSTSATSGEDTGEEIKDGKSLLTDCDKVTEADNRSKQMDLESDSEVTESCKESTCHMETSSSVFSSPRVSHLPRKWKQKKKTKIVEMLDTAGDSLLCIRENENPLNWKPLMVKPHKVTQMSKHLIEQVNHPCNVAQVQVV